MSRATIGMLIAVGAACLIAYRLDGYVLRTVARNLTQGLSAPEDQVLALNHWIHAHLPTARNRASFAWSRLRATPVQVLELGGDCADKSRLLSTMLRELGIPATMVMLFDPRTGQPTHTVVEASTAAGAYMVVDPSFELHFPDPSGHGYLGLIDLRRDPEALPRRLTELQASHPWPALYHFYPVTYAPYDRASTINWNKNAITVAAHARLHRWFGDEVYRWSRPVALEEPTLFVGLAAWVLAIALIGITRIMAFVRRRNAPASYDRTTVPTGSQMISEALNTGPSVQHNR